MRGLAFLAILGAFILLPLPLTQASGQTEPSPEMQALDFLVGEWAYVNSQGESMGTDVCEWLGTGFVQCMASGTNAAGNTIKLLSVFGYDAAMERYTWVRYWSTGLIDDHIGWLDEDILRWVQRDSAGGRYRVTMNIESPTAMSFQWEQSVRGGDWQPGVAGRATKVR